MADLLRHLEPQHLYGIRSSFERHFDSHAEYYRAQPPEIRALADPAEADDVRQLLRPTTISTKPATPRAVVKVRV